MTDHKVVSREEWLAARLEHLSEEKAFDKQRDALSKKRRALPWVKIDQDYAFDGPNGKETLADLFADKSQLLVYHFMLGPTWKAGCPSCSFWADNFDPAVVHLKARDVSFAAISRAPFEKIAAYQKRMGWSFKWVSSHANTFNEDFHVSFSQDEIDSGEVYYNYKKQKPGPDELPGASAFIKEDGVIYHTYSTYGRGLDKLNGTYHWLDVAPKGRDEDALAYSQAWVKRHDEY